MQARAVQEYCFPVYKVISQVPRRPGLLKVKVSAEINVYKTTAATMHRGPGIWRSFQPPTDETARIAIALEAGKYFE